MLRRQLLLLEKWLSRLHRKPLIVRGARQVGKSTLIRDFATVQKLVLHEINLEQHKELKAVLASNNPDRILREFQFTIGLGNIDSPNSLLFIDEIQAIPQALEALRYLAEKFPSLPIIAAGSLLEFSLSDHEYSMPVGRVEYLFMGPLTFEEFLSAADEFALVEYLRSFKIADGDFSLVAHEKLMEWYRLFILVGGMPEAADVFLATKDFNETRRIQGSIVATYRDDFAKYAKGTELILLQRMLDYVSTSLGEKIKYSNVDPDAKSADLKKVLFLLYRAQIVDLAYHSSGSESPLRAQANFNIFKPYYLDCGLVSHILGGFIRAPQQVQSNYEGKMAEQFIAQHLLTLGDSMSRPELYYWLREGKQHNAEVDFLVAIKGQILPIEVKSGSAGSLKSLHQFVAARKSRLAVRFSQSILEKSLVSAALTSSAERVSFTLLSLPLYMVGQMERLVSDVGE